MMLALAIRLGNALDKGEKGKEHEVALPAEPWVLGVGTFLFLCALLWITWQFNRDR